jgi:hypothetical protein
VELCIAKPNVLRCVGCFLFPFAMLGWYVYKIGPVGHDVPSYLSVVFDGTRNQISVVLFIVASAWWVVVTWPKARAALQTKECTISLSQQRLSFYGESIQRSEIVSTELIRQLLRNDLRVRLKDGSVVQRSVVLLSPSPDRILEKLRAQGL